MFRLACQLGCTVAELGMRMSSAELTEWQAFYMLEPWGMEPAALNTAIVSATLANVHRSTGAQAYSPVDFMPVYDLPKAPLVPTEAERSNQIRQLLQGT